MPRSTADRGTLTWPPSRTPTMCLDWRTWTWPKNRAGSECIRPAWRPGRGRWEATRPAWLTSPTGTFHWPPSTAVEPWGLMGNGRPPPARHICPSSASQVHMAPPYWSLLALLFAGVSNWWQQCSVIRPMVPFYVFFSITYFFKLFLCNVSYLLCIQLKGKKHFSIKTKIVAVQYHMAGPTHQFK